MKEKYENWTSKFMESWKNLNYESVLTLLDTDVKYYENPIDEPCANFDEVKKLWEVVADNQRDIEYKFEVVVCNDKVGIINWQMKRTLTAGDIIQEIDGIFEISLDNADKCTYFKQWRYTR